MARRRGQGTIRLEADFSEMNVGGSYYKDLNVIYPPKRDESIYVGDVWIGSVSDFSHSVEGGNLIYVVIIDTYYASEGKTEVAQSMVNALLADGWQQAP